MDYVFSLDFQVRDYECDLQGVVNNAVYQNYLEHTRHEFIKQLGLDFAELASRGINLVVLRTELDYKYSLKSGDRFWVGLNMERVSRLRIEFQQGIYLAPDDRLVLAARTVGTGVSSSGRPDLPEELTRFLDQSSG